MIRYFHSLKDFFLKNFHLKLISVSLALLLWVTINGEPKSEISFKVPLEYRNPPKGIEVMDDTVNAIDVRLSASTSLIKRLEATDITAAIDLSEWNPGERTYSISAANIRVPFGVSITKITPNKVRLKFEPTQEKAVDIRPRVIGRVAEGYRVESINCQPGATRIEGPGGHLSAIRFISTDSIDISGRSESYKMRVHLFVEDPLVRLSDDQQTSVEVVIVPVALGKRQ
jgi:YbbR domain-containing protein